MAITVTGRAVEKGPKFVTEVISGTFATTDTSGSVTLSALKTIRHHSFGVLGAPPNAQGLGLNHSMVSGRIVVPSNGFINIVRTDTASGLAFTLMLAGNF